MKILLTSGGITNESIKTALFDLVGKKPEDTSLVFIPTASNVEQGDKSWLIDDLINFKKLNLKAIHIADISAVEESIWRPQLESSDIIFFEGGNVYHLMNWINKTNLNSTLSELLKDKVYVGLSAGSMVACKDLVLNISQKIYEEDLDQTVNIPGLNYVNFYFLPHLNSPWFPKVKDNNYIREVAKDIKDKIYVMDDNSAIKILDDKVEIISEGVWFKIN